MFNSITGIITAKLPKQLFLENNGIEWDICIPDSNLDMLPSVGSEGKVYTYLQHTEQLMNLFGFATNDERTLFLDLLKVDGVGPKGAVKIMSCVTSSRLLSILENDDLASLEAIPGIGKKTAGKMILALKGKVHFGEETVTVKGKNVMPYTDVVNSLVSMGYDKKTVEQKIAELTQELSSDEDFSAKNQKEKEDFLFRRAVVGLA
ncbi:MAG: Holliday junction branch migration protein RuvA [Treponema sp.]|nr:Holliday junction branch migration protein RuvA [Treponema sp.]